MKDDQFNSFPQGMYYAHYFKGGHIDQSAFEELSGTYNVPCMECWSLLIKFDILCSARVISQRFFPKGNFKAFKFFFRGACPTRNHTCQSVSEWVTKMFETSWSCIVLYGPLWFPMAPYWPVILYGPLWFIYHAMSQNIKHNEREGRGLWSIMIYENDMEVSVSKNTHK